MLIIPVVCSPTDVKARYEAGTITTRETTYNSNGYALRDFLARVNISGFDTNSYIDSIRQNTSEMLNVAIALLGGGYRALMHGAGVVLAFDNQTQNLTLPGHDGGLLQTSIYLSGLPGGSWLSASALLPIVLALERAPNQLVIPLNSTSLNFEAGVLPDTERCISGFDNAGFVAYLQINKSDIPSRLQDYLTGKLEEVGKENSDNSSNANNLQNIPFYPLLQPLRQVDVIFAVVSSADTGAPGAYWPNGTALVATTFVNLGLNLQPTFFGCDMKNLSEPSPLIVYVPNHPFTYNLNILTFQLMTNDTERNSIIQNGYNVAIRGNGTLDKDWPRCIGCAVLSRSFERNAVKPPAVCN
ncbi:FabD/lysophospholipase-like protein [Pyrenochaeta sp. DS3sAY3a]|nr:FabD/lysophospholipase-like protein [Pyrenochaeta sp. DS3sAY3a]